jgi:Sulfotransferase domain
MALKVVGSGLGRTGTKSMQSALNILGVGPCHHMVEVFAHPESMALWIEAGKGRPNWDAIFDGYYSMVDYPGAHYWRELAAYYPDAKVLHTVRDPDQWFDSTQATIFAPDSAAVGDSERAEFFGSFVGPMRAHLQDRAYMTKHFLDHTEAVKATIAPERLLIYQAGQGWEPLCKFLGVPVPDVPYPSENSRAEFVARTNAHRGHIPTQEEAQHILDTDSAP